MSKLVDLLVAQSLRLQVNLQASQARLQAVTDCEALHDLRIALRRLRSLLRPLRSLAPAAELDQAAAALGQLSGPLRDTEVLLPELQRRGLDQALASRRAHLQQGYTQLLLSPELRRLQQTLDQWPEALRELQRSGALRQLKKRLRRKLTRQLQQLRAALADPGHDRHRLRLLIKRVRYADESYPQLQVVKPSTHRALKVAQSALGEWHDLLQWLLRAETEADLRGVIQDWQRALSLAEVAADQALQPLQDRLTP